MKNTGLLVLVLLLISSGCVSKKDNPYEIRFNQKLRWGTSSHFVTGKEFSVVSGKVSAALYTLGYGHPVYENPLFGFMVVNKNGTGASSKQAGPETPQILVKFTQWQTGQTRVDFANGENTLEAARTAERDIAVLIGLLKSKGLVDSEKIFR